MIDPLIHRVDEIAGLQERRRHAGAQPKPTAPRGRQHLEHLAEALWRGAHDRPQFRDARLEPPELEQAMGEIESGAKMVRAVRQHVPELVGGAFASNRSSPSARARSSR